MESQAKKLTDTGEIGDWDALRPLVNQGRESLGGIARHRVIQPQEEVSPVNLQHESEEHLCIEARIVYSGSPQAVGCLT
jgi:hypothetical protein